MPSATCAVVSAISSRCTIISRRATCTPGCGRPRACAESSTRLSAEHRTVHGLIERIRDIVRSVAVDPTVERVLALKEVYEVFERVVVSHFGYEERELEEAIGYYNAIIDVPIDVSSTKSLTDNEKL